MRRLISLGAAVLLTMTVVSAFVAEPAHAATGILSTARVTVATSLAAPSPMAGPLEYDRTNISSIGGYAHTDKISIAMGGGTANRSFSLDLQAPTGTTFTTGMYYGDDPYGVRGYAYLGEGSQSCSYVRFTILDIAASGTDVTRLDVRFQSTCNYTSNDNAVIFGELQLGEPAAAPNLVTGARSISWPNVPVGTRSRALLPLWYRNTASTSQSVGSVSRSGANPADFPVVSDGCSNKTLAAHTSCSVVLAFAPRAAGVRSATLTVPIAGRNVSTGVAGTGSGGRTLLRINSQAGDWVGGGRSYLITDAQFQMQVANVDPTIFEATTYNGAYSWSLSVKDPTGPLKVGSYPATKDGSNGLRFWVAGQGRGCTRSTGTVNIRQVAFDADDNPIAFDATFSQTCSDTPGASLTGEVAYRATNTPTAPSGPFIVQSGHSLAAGKSISNTDEGSNSFKLAVTTAGRAVLTNSAGKLLWATPATAVEANDRLAVRSAGDLSLLTSAGSVLWTTGTTGSGNFLVLQTDGNLVLYNSGYRPIWASGTAQPTS